MLFKKNTTQSVMNFYRRALATLHKPPHHTETVVYSGCEYKNNYGYEAAYIVHDQKNKEKSRVKT